MPRAGPLRSLVDQPVAERYDTFRKPAVLLEDAAG